MGKTDTKAIDQLADGLKSQPRLNITGQAATDAKNAVNACADKYSGNVIPEINGTPPKLLSASFVESDLKDDVIAFKDKFAAVVKVLQATGSSITDVSEKLKNISNNVGR